MQNCPVEGCYNIKIALLFYIVVKHVAWVPLQTIEV